jgi:2-polyprenyl-3-methyl-5-hydroxy-6-metoxy-1,4-benzoquinol methylase
MDKQKIAARWSDKAIAFDAFSPELYWLAVPAVQARHQRRSCAGRDYPSWVDYCLSEFMPALPAQRMLSVGCGQGALERQLHALGAFQECDAFDIASGAIDQARTAAASAGMFSINYRACDIEEISLGEAIYDAVWFNGSLHHIEALESVLERVRAALKPNGLLFVHEYVGANHFDFSQTQKEAIERAFLLIPPAYRKSFLVHNYGETAMTAPLPDPVEVARADPSEAVRSSQILPTVNAFFDILALNPSGGSLMQFLLSGIAGNFRADTPKSMAVLEMLFCIEDTLIDTGALASDFVVCAARPKHHFAAFAEEKSAADLRATFDQARARLSNLQRRSISASAEIERLRQSLSKIS